jgi:hypothetical protein
MCDNDRIQAVRHLIFDFVRSPSLRHLRDTHSVDRLSRQIIQSIDREPSVWRKWEGQREGVIRAASCCWVPSEDLRAFLNSLPGPMLSPTDVAQRLRAIHEEPYSAYPDQNVREGCLALYQREVAEGTELPAIIGALQEFVEDETERLRNAQEAARRQRRKEEQLALEQRFLAGADCKWTSIQKSKDLFTRKNGRAYRLAPNKHKRWELFRIDTVDDTGVSMGTYGSRGDASKALTKLAYEPEPGGNDRRPALASISFCLWLGVRTPAERRPRISPMFLPGVRDAFTTSNAGTEMRSPQRPLWHKGEMVPPGGIEPTTSALPRMRSTTELRRPLRRAGYSERRGGLEVKIGLT